MMTLPQLQALGTVRAIVDAINKAVDSGDTERKALGYSLLGEYGEAALLIGVPKADIVAVQRLVKSEPVTQDGDDCTETCCR